MGLNQSVVCSSRLRRTAKTSGGEPIILCRERRLCTSNRIREPAAEVEANLCQDLTRLDPDPAVLRDGAGEPAYRSTSGPLSPRGSAPKKASRHSRAPAPLSKAAGGQGGGVAEARRATDGRTFRLNQQFNEHLLHRKSPILAT